MTSDVNLFLVGAHKAGTTAIYKCLEQSDQIYFPVIKEPSYFYTATRGKQTIGPYGLDKYSSAKINTLKEYKSLYERAGDCKYWGDASTIYLYADVAEEIQNYNPNSKIIISLRNPVDRAYSAFNYVRMEQLEPCEKFTEAVELERKRIGLGWGPDWHYISRGYYYNQVKKYIDVFGAENVLIVVFEDFLKDQEGLIRQLESFLGVDLPLEKLDKVNDTYVAVNSLDKWFRTFIAKSSIVKSLLKRVIPLKLRRKIVEYLLYERSWGKGERPRPIDSRDKDSIRALFDADIENLEKLLGRDLGNVW